ncbi:nucleotidyl transferase AbiEii/AbiGii toxin family protein [Sulfurospirillum sp. SCADC]|uniref:nucleotidyl transferase AbiEii/AbiGii toxin family protein n=1 Tax=Sulfurospirillum sp. SCADC TaxID=1537915 RepID=UPI0005079CDB|nr:nucleotidyl transferase AbiEii/AbiGii toxin family protein [Sulfurospirillum sp. SCADC]KFL32970.1 hypothetical protein JU57_13730 [Sulfurospirillum sp. SCADC]
MQDLKNLNCLLPKTKELLFQMVESCGFLHKYVLVGGSALTLHICHRKSEDLDFFTYEDSLNKKEILEFIQGFETKEIINQTDEQIDLLLNGVKVTFFNAKWSFLKPQHIANFNLATIEMIAAMKVNVLFLRAKYRDYYDIYFLAKEKMSLRDMYRASEHIVEGITYKLFVTGLLYIDDIEDDDIRYLEPKETVTKVQMRTFFEKRV